MGFTKFCAALLNHPNTELQAIPQTILDQVLCLYLLAFHSSPASISSSPGESTSRGCCRVVLAADPLPAGRLRAPPSKFPPVWLGFVSQGLEALSGPRSSSITRRAAGFPMLFLCIVSGENPAQARPLLTRCIQTLLALATMALPQDWDQTLDLPQVTAVHADPFAVKASLGMGRSIQSPTKGSVCVGYCSMRLSVPGAARLSSTRSLQVCALHVLQTLVRGAGLGAALLRHATPMVALALRGLSSPCWAMRNAAIQLFSEYPSFAPCLLSLLAITSTLAPWVNPCSSAHGETGTRTAPRSTGACPHPFFWVDPSAGMWHYPSGMFDVSPPCRCSHHTAAGPEAEQH